MGSELVSFANVLVGGVVAVAVAWISRGRGDPAEAAAGTALESLADLAGEQTRLVRALRRYVRQLRAAIIVLGAVPPEPADPGDADLIRTADEP
ncbi:hypothetical protein [Streptomyces sp. Z26]|uniref:hypothetical protein n=1 Tax=Streptomyces sp. Z26 TaxID=2500177 RepID=UPI000EF152EA|nr:hypothetical protein [Streptomyces sp. Z26]RLL62459.1 hypothetical protein D7M15_28115 [Streptomyces sp. Z26]RLL68121.1 hypothetical protein D7M15_16170 [Streptomyces sp. Z26]